MLLIDMKPFFDAAEEENRILRKNGAKDRAEAREIMLAELNTYITKALEETVTVSTASTIANVSHETVRRFARKNKHKDLRETKAKGSPIVLKKSDVLLLEGRSRKKKGNIDRSGTMKYDTGAHFDRIAQRL